MNTVIRFLVSQPTCRKILLVILHWLAGQLGITILPKGWMMFDPALAKTLDNINSAIIFQKISGWVESNAKRNHNIIDGRAWSYNSYPDWARDAFVWLHPKTVGSHIRKLEKMKLLISKQMNPDLLKREKWYSTLNSSDGSQLRLWQDEATPVVVTNEGDVYNKKPTKNKPSKQKQSTTTARGAGAVASFQNPKENRELPESIPPTVEARSASNEGGDALALEGALDKASASRTSPSSAPPPSPEQRFHADIRAFWPTCEAEPALRDLIARRGESHALAVIRYVKTQRCDSPQALGRVLLAQGFMPPGYAPQEVPTHIPRPDFDTTEGDTDTSSVDADDVPTETDADDTPAPDTAPLVDPASPEAIAWNTAYSQLEVQLDRASFDTWLYGARLYEVDGNTFTVAVSNQYAAEMLQYRLIRDIKRIVEEVYGQPVELKFEMHKQSKPKTEPLPLFKLLAQKPEVQPDGKWVA